jgi:flagellar biogenesis protein FliO
MARWSGPLICFSLALLAGAGAVAAPNDRSDDSSHGSSVQRATYESAAPTLRDRPGQSPAVAPERAAAMPMGAAGRETVGSDKTSPHTGRFDLPAAPSAAPAIVSMLGSLAIVLGLFFGLVWFMRRGLPKGSRIVPSEVVEVVGRAPLAARQQMHVVRFGPKLVLVSVSAGGAEALAEITDAAEVDRLAGICQQAQPNSATNAFRQVFRQFAGDRSAGESRSATGKKTVVPMGTEDDDV